MQQGGACLWQPTKRRPSKIAPAESCERQPDCTYPTEIWPPSPCLLDLAPPPAKERRELADEFSASRRFNQHHQKAPPPSECIAPAPAVQLLQLSEQALPKGISPTLPQEDTPERTPLAPSTATLWTTEATSLPQALPPSQASWDAELTCPGMPLAAEVLHEPLPLCSSVREPQEVLASVNGLPLHWPQITERFQVPFPDSRSLEVAEPECPFLQRPPSPPHMVPVPMLPSPPECPPAYLQIQTEVSREVPPLQESESARGLPSASTFDQQSPTAQMPLPRFVVAAGSQSVFQSVSIVIKNDVNIRDAGGPE